MANTLRKFILALLPIAVFTACQKADYTYSSLPAKFIFENTYQAPVLYTACNSMGEFCTIYSDGKRLVFNGSPKEPSYVNLTALNGYTGFKLGLSGLIVGLPNIPEIGTTESHVICFDWACPNCWEDYAIAPRLEVRYSEGIAMCSRCKRTYDLNNAGFISNGEAGRALFRYRVNYEKNALIVSN